MNLLGSLKTGLAWLAGMALAMGCFMAFAAIYMALTKVPLTHFLSIAGLTVLSALCGAQVLAWTKSFATWLRKVMGA